MGLEGGIFKSRSGSISATKSNARTYGTPQQQQKDKIRMATEFAIHTFESAETGTEAGRVTHMPPKVIATRGAEAEAAESQRNSQTAPFTWLRACINIESCAPVAINNFQSQCGTNAGSAAAAAATLALVFTTNAASAGTDETNQRATMSRNPTCTTQAGQGKPYLETSPSRPSPWWT